MKKIITMILLVILMALPTMAQVFDAPTSDKQFTDTTTTKKYRIDGKLYDVYRSKKGAFYVWKTSKKTNKNYKYYIPKEVQIKMGRKY